MRAFRSEREGEPAGPAPVRGSLPAGDLKIPAVLVRLLLPLAGLVSVYFPPSRAPGAGRRFVGGLVMATAVIAQYMVGGTIWVESRLRVHPLTWVGLGLSGCGNRRHARMAGVFAVPHGAHLRCSHAHTGAIFIFRPCFSLIWACTCW